MIKPQPKRTTTQPGLGHVKAPGEGRRTTTREQLAAEGVTAPASKAPTSSAPGSRNTQEIGSSRGADPAPRSESAQQERSDTKPPQSQAPESRPPASKSPQSARLDRIERDDDHDGSSAVARPRTPIDVVTVDPKRLERASPSRLMDQARGVSRGSADRRTIDSDADGRHKGVGARFPDETTTGTRRTTIEGKPTGSRTVDGRPISNRPAAERARVTTGRPSLRPGSARPARASSKPPGKRARGESLAPPASASKAAEQGAVARSKRPSIREDDVGPAAKGGVGAVGALNRVVPKLLRTKAEIAVAPIDHRAGFLLAYIDEKTTVQALVDISGMPEEDVHEILERLGRLGIVGLR